MAKPFKDKLKNAGELISGAIADVGTQAKDRSALVNSTGIRGKDCTW